MGNDWFDNMTESINATSREIRQSSSGGANYVLLSPKVVDIMSDIPKHFSNRIRMFIWTVLLRPPNGLLKFKQNYNDYKGSLDKLRNLDCGKYIGVSSRSKI